MEDINSAKQRVHKIMLTNRRTCTINGVSDVLSFDIHEILLETDQGMLMIRGDDLHVNRLTLEKGEVDIDGRVDSLTYSDTVSHQGKNQSLLSKLFK
ncbi:MAG: sporulation protein YabP [Lachnospiraceae bacterium]|nr:sporulation protein YabP [Lachnospiraceae bacterium]